MTLNTDSDVQPLAELDEETLRADLTVAMHKLETILRAANALWPGATTNEIAHAVAHLELFESVLAEVDLLLAALHDLDGLSPQGNQLLGSLAVVMLRLRDAQADMTAAIDMATS